MIALRSRAALPWWPAAVALAVAVAALGAALLVPLAFSDPNGVDPYMVRLAICSLVLLAVAGAVRRLAPARAVLIAVAAATASFTVLSALPQLLFNVLGTRSPSGAALVFWASLAQVIVTFALGALVLRLVPRDLLPGLRLRSFGLTAAGVSVAGVALLLLVALALPAEWLGRDALQPVSIARDLAWVGPANALQALAQEVQYRSLLMGALERVMPRGWANLAQACFFGLSHLAVNYQGPVAPFVPVTVAVGLVLGWIVQRTGSVWPAVIIHAAADIAIAVAVLQGLYGY